MAVCKLFTVKDGEVIAPRAGNGPLFGGNCRVLIASEFTPEKVAAALNEAYDLGVYAAKAEMRRVLGVGR